MMVIEPGAREWVWISGGGCARPKAVIAQREHERDAKSMILSSDKKQVRLQFSILLVRVEA
jgi:hypothetical protein